MDTDTPPTYWQEINPICLFRCCPADFTRPADSISLCPGIFWLPGIVGLIALHAISIRVAWWLWSVGWGWALLSLIPLVTLWLWFGAADVKFRRQQSTRQERRDFDEAVVNWFGNALFFTSPILILFLIALGLLWWFV